MLPQPLKPIFVLGKSFLSTFVSKFVWDEREQIEIVQITNMSDVYDCSFSGCRSIGFYEVIG